MADHLIKLVGITYVEQYKQYVDLHALQYVKVNNETYTKLMNRKNLRYRIGWDFVGRPIYMEVKMTLLDHKLNEFDLFDEVISTEDMLNKILETNE